MGPPVVLSIWTPPVYSCHSVDASGGSDAHRRIILVIGLSEHVVGFVMDFIHAYRNDCLFSRLDCYRAYTVFEAVLDQHWNANRRIISMPQPLLNGIDKFGILEVVAGCSLDLARDFSAYHLTKTIHWVRAPAAFFYYDFKRTTVSVLDAGMSRDGRRLAAQVPIVRKDISWQTSGR